MGWSVDQVATMTGREIAWASVLCNAAAAAARRGARYAVWYFRRLVDVSQEEFWPRMAPPAGTGDATGRDTHAWRAFLAGAPVLDAWLQIEAATQLAAAMRERAPWPIGAPPRPDRALGHVRHAYVAVANPHVRAIRQRVADLAFESAIGLPAAGIGGPFGYLTAVGARLPLVDTARKGAPHRELAMWQLLAGVFVHEAAPTRGRHDD